MILDSNKRLFLGMMSGTSMDGIDISLIMSDGENIFEQIDNMSVDYQKDYKKIIYNPDVTIRELLLFEREFTLLHADAIGRILTKNKLSHSDISAIGFSGQTIYFSPKESILHHIGDPHLLSRRTNIDVVHDFRRADLAAGGYGAPLIPIFHKLLLSDQKKPAMIVNIGGISNLTYVDNDDIDELIGFDIGVGMCLIDDMVNKHFDKKFDDNGEIATRGRVDKILVEKFLENPYFSKSYPKSLDRHDFHYLVDEVESYDPYDIIATFTYFTAAAIVDSIKLLPTIPHSMFLCGGGAQNMTLISFIKKILIEKNISTQVQNIEIINKHLNIDYIESQGFGYLAARALKRKPSSFPSTTGVQEPQICGVIVSQSDR